MILFVVVLVIAIYLLFFNTAREPYTIRENLNLPSNIQMNLGNGSMTSASVDTGNLQASSVDTSSLHVKGKIQTDGGIQISRVDGGTFTQSGNYRYGNWINNKCPENEYVCGIDSRHEPNQGNGDDGGMTGLRFHCCKFNT